MAKAGDGPCQVELRERDIACLEEAFAAPVNSWGEGVPGWWPLVPGRGVQRWLEAVPPSCRSLLVAESAGEMVGACLSTSRRELGVGWLWFLAVAPGTRRRGIGRELLRRAEEAAVRQGSLKLLASVGARNLAGQAFLGRAGFRPSWESFRMACPLPGIAPVRLPEGYRLRLFREADALELVRVVNEAFGDVDDLWWNRGAADLRRNLLERDGVRWMSIFLAEYAGEAVGTITAWCQEDREGLPQGWLEELAVVPAHRGRGLGRALVRSGFNRLFEEGFSKACLYTGTRYQVALSLYHRLGFQVEERWTVLEKSLQRPGGLFETEPALDGDG